MNIARRPLLYWLVGSALLLAAIGCARPKPQERTDSGSSADASALPDKECRFDEECDGGFCDRSGYCEQLDQQTRLGQTCALPARLPNGRAIGLLNSCGAYPCIAGRCQSCLDDAECQIEYGAPSCRRVGAMRGYRCGDDSQLQARAPDAGITPRSDEEPLHLTVEVVRTYPHDPGAFTEGLIYANGELLEGTGIEGESQLRRVALANGEVLQAIDLDAEVFGEGIALHDDRIVQLTWKTERAYIWDAASMAAKGQYEYRGEGWGLCHNGQQFVMSDGSSTLQLRDTQTFELKGTVELAASGARFRDFRLNELECVGDEVFANVYEYREIARISLTRGKVTAWIDTRNLLDHPDVPRDPLSNVRDLNGIAYIAENGHLLLTGKRWPRVFEVQLIPDRLFR